MKICICDNENFAVEEISNLIKRFDKTEIEFEVSCFASGEELEKCIKNGNKFDIVFLCVEIGGKNGIAVAENIKKFFPETTIILISNHSANIVDAFKVEAFCFLTKPVKKEEFDDAFFRALKKYRKNNNDLVFKWGNERYRVRIDDILFVEGYHRHIVVHTFDRKFESVGKLTEMYDYLRSFSFVRIHQGYIVNMKYIKNFCKNEVVLIDGSVVDMSVRKKQDALKIYDEYIKKWCW